MDRVQAFGKTFRFVMLSVYRIGVHYDKYPPLPRGSVLPTDIVLYLAGK